MAEPAGRRSWSLTIALETPAASIEPDFIHFAFKLGLSGDSWELDRTEDIVAELRSAACAWVHLQSDRAETLDWIETHLAYLPDAVRDSLTANITRPRLQPYGDGVLLNLRGVNHNPGAEPEDMISIRIGLIRHGS